jgi:hypothetical protein
MNEIGIIIGALLLLLLMAKKTDRLPAWQTTLTGSKALRWLENGMSISPVRLSFGTAEAMVEAGWNINLEYHAGKPCVIVNDGVSDRLPTFIHQGTAVAWAMSVATSWEENGATPELANLDSVAKPDSVPAQRYDFNRGEAQFAQWVVTEDENTDAEK